MRTLDRLRDHITEVPIQLRSVSEHALTQHLPGKWSRKELLGHLIDSAINNLKRFTDAQSTEGIYSIIPYDQNKLVLVNRYQTLPLEHLLTLWSSLNHQIVAVVEFLPDTVLEKPVRLGGANQGGEPLSDKTLAWLIDDYVLHLEHHLKTLLS